MDIQFLCFQQKERYTRSGSPGKIIMQICGSSEGVIFLKPSKQGHLKDMLFCKEIKKQRSVKEETLINVQIMHK